MILYVPNPHADPRTALSLHHILPGSAIVGSEYDQDIERVLIYYEGNRYGMTNLRTWADRVHVAGWRLRAHAPTSAMCAAPRAALLEVGVIDFDDKVHVHDRSRLADYLRTEDLDSELMRT